jgi:hypothetical protein
MAPPTATETATNTVTVQAPESSQAAGAQNAKVKMDMPSQPVFADKMQEREFLKGRLAAAFRIFGKYGYDEGMSLHSPRGRIRELISVRCRWTYHPA